MRVDSVNRVRIFTKFFTIFVSSFAFLIVAFLTAIAGYALAAPEFSWNYLVTHGLTLIITYILLLWPYYASRHGLLERNFKPGHPLDIDSIRYGIEYPIYIALSVIVIAFYTFGSFYFQPDFVGQLREIATTIFLGLLPFFVVFAASLRNLVSENTDQAFQFTERVLYPALCTGIIPFSYGWSIATGTINLSVIVASTIYVVLLIIYAKIKDSGELARASSVIGLALILFMVTMREEFKVIVLGTVILLAMGVSEASKRVYQAKIKDRHYPSDQGIEYYLAGANWSSIVFPWLLCIVPLLIDELPTYPFLLFILAQSLSWFIAKEDFKFSKAASIISLLFGYGLPIIIIITRVMHISTTLLPRSISFERAVIPIGLAIGLIGVIAGNQDFIKEYFKSKKMLNVNTYLDRTNSHILFLLVLTTTIIIATTFGAFTNDPIRITKATEIIIYCTIVFFGLGFWLLIQSQQATKNINGKQE